MQWRFYIGARGAKPPQITGKEGFCPPKFQRWYIIFFAGVVTLTELTGSAAATYEATASVKFVASSSLPVKSRYYFLKANQLFCFRVDIDKVIRQTYTHTCSIPTYIYRDIHTFLHTCMNSYIKQAPLLSHRS